MAGFGFPPLRFMRCNNCDTKLERVYEKRTMNGKAKYRHVMGEYRCPNCRIYYSRTSKPEQQFFDKGDIEDPYYK